jgi:hypothetical protein
MGDASGRKECPKREETGVQWRPEPAILFVCKKALQIFKLGIY